MTRIFDPAFIGGHDLFHARYGRGVVVIAVPKDPDPETAGKRRSRGLHVARLFNDRGPRDWGGTPAFEPVLAIEEQSGFVRMTLQAEYRSPNNHRHMIASASIERVMPLEQVMLEIVHTDEP